MHKPRKTILPGDFVYAVKPAFGDLRALPGLVIGVSHPRALPGHFGCEDRIKVLWMQTLRLSEVCDCDLVTFADLEAGPEGPREKVQSR